MSDNIKVVVKVRPLISREIEEKLSYQWRVKNNTLHQLDQNGKDFGTCYTFGEYYFEHFRLRVVLLSWEDYCDSNENVYSIYVISVKVTHIYIV